MLLEDYESYYVEDWKIQKRNMHKTCRRDAKCNPDIDQQFLTPGTVEMQDAVPACDRGTSSF